MKRCPYCAEKIQDDAIKCRFCGEWLSKTPESSVAKEFPVPGAIHSKKKEPENFGHESKECPRCGALNPGSAQKCNCGHDFDKRSSDLIETDAQIPPDDKERLTAEDEIVNLDDNQVRAFRVKFDSMTIGELLGIRDSYVPQDYTPEARHVLDEIFSRKKDDLDLEKAASPEDKEPSKRKKRIPNIALFYIYSILVITSIIGILTIYILVGTGISKGLGSIGPTELILLLVIFLTCLWFLVAIGLLKLKRTAYIINDVLLTIGLIGNIIRLLLGGGTFQGRFVSSLPGLAWCGGWLIYFSIKERYFDH